MPTAQRPLPHPAPELLWPPTVPSHAEWPQLNGLLWPAAPCALPQSAYVHLSAGRGGLPKVTLRTPDAASAEIYLHGAQVTSWKAADGKERLFLSDLSPFRVGEAIWGGIPLAFPQFGRFGALPIHGVARLMTWEWLGAQWLDGCLVARLRLAAPHHAHWQHCFTANVELTVTLSSAQLVVSLHVCNTGETAGNFTAGLHTYLALDDAQSVALHGLDGLDYLDACGGLERRQTTPWLDFSREINRIYFAAPPAVSLAEASRITGIQARGFHDLVVWNPAVQRCASIAELAADAYQHFICVEAVQIGTPITLAPGECWQGEQRLIAA